MENQINTMPVDKTPEQIETEMFQTRESLTEKVAALENQVVGTVQNAANTLTDTVDAALDEVIKLRQRRRLVELLFTPGQLQLDDPNVMAGAWR